MLEHYWHVACESKELKQKPVARIMFNVPVVLFRTDNGKAAALEDRCAHRNAPLSAGSVRCGTIECPYHGWRYRSDGSVAEIPSLCEGQIPPNTGIQNFPVFESDGYVWVCLSPVPQQSEPFRFPHYGQPGWTSFRMQNRFAADVETCLENFLDCPHAAYVHRGWFRTPTRKVTKAELRTLEDGAEVEYSEEPREGSVVWKLLSRKGSQLKHTDRFIEPSTSRVDYIFSDGRQYVISSTCTPVSEQETIVYTMVSFKFSKYFAPLVRICFEPLCWKIIRQDIEVIKKQQENVRRFGEKKLYRYIETDLLGPEIVRRRNALKNESTPPMGRQRGNTLSKNIAIRI